MKPPQPLTPPQPPVATHGRARLAARLAVIAAFVCFTMNCVLNQFILRGAPDQGRVWNLVVGSLSTLVVAAGVVLGAGALFVGIRRQDYDTAGIALIGLLLNLGILFVMFWALSALGHLNGNG
jgi:hypothetical protein